jgi:LmbE family N-acetylglucosaminyl deacetylase
MENERPVVSLGIRPLYTHIAEKFIMLPFLLHAKASHPFRILCLGAHSDDIEIGCGGTILSLAKRYPQAAITWVIFSSGSDREAEGRRSADLFLANVAKSEVFVKNFRDGFFPSEYLEIKEFFEELKKNVSPDLILTHYRHDRHQDHRVLSDLAWNTWRNHLILEYEIPKYDGDLSAPNVFMPLDAATCRKKVRILQKCFGTQRSKQWFTEETFMGLMRLRGIECKAPGSYAEAFYGYKLRIS